jgi:hypothetical protein
MKLEVCTFFSDSYKELMKIFCSIGKRHRAINQLTIPAFQHRRSLDEAWLFRGKPQDCDEANAGEAAIVEGGASDANA